MRYATGPYTIPPFKNPPSDARMVKLVDTRDLKSLGRKAVPVRFRLRAPFFRAKNVVLALAFSVPQKEENRARLQPRFLNRWRSYQAVLAIRFLTPNPSRPRPSKARVEGSGTETGREVMTPLSVASLSIRSMVQNSLASAPL